MKTANRAETTKEAPVTPEAFTAYFEKLTERHDEISKAVQENHQRSQRIGTEFVSALVAGQKDLLELTQQIATKPQDIAANVKAMMDAVSVAQERALNLAKVLYREQAEAGADVRKAFQASGVTSDAFTDASRKILNFWTKQG